MFLVKVTGVHFDSFTMLGYILMVGLVVKNAIILITYAVQLMEREGMDRNEALVLASRRRMRPIFMTAIAMVSRDASSGCQAWSRCRDLQRSCNGSGGRAFRRNTLHVGVHPGCPYDPRGSEGSLLESSADSLG